MSGDMKTWKHDVSQNNEINLVLINFFLILDKHGNTEIGR